MRMMNRAIEDAADASDFINKLQQPNTNLQQRQEPKLTGESRTQYRARMRALEKNAKKGLKV